MTAKEIAKKIKEGSPFGGGFDDWEAEQMIQDYAREKCKEQRVNCVHNLIGGFVSGEGHFSSVGTESWRTLNQKQIAKIICDESTEPEMD